MTCLSAWKTHRFSSENLWPAEYRCAVTLGIHFDGETLWSSLDPKNADRPVTQSLGRYGAVRGVGALLRLLAKHALPGTFFVPGSVAESYPETVGSILSHGHTIAHHGYVHARTDDATSVKYEIEAGLAALVKVANVRPRGYAAPGWILSSSYLDILVEYGFEYSANMMDDIFPYLNIRTDGVRLVELPVHWLLDDAPFRTVGPDVSKSIASAREIGDIWLEEFRGIYREGGLFHLTLHPQVSGRPSMIESLDSVLQELQRYPDVLFATCESICEIVRHAEAYL